MIITEIVMIDGKQYKHTFSTTNHYIRKVGTEEVYPEVFDSMNSSFEYEEIGEQIIIKEEDELKLTRGDVFRGLLKSRGITRQQIRGIIENMSEETTEEKLTKELALIDFDEAIYFYRRNPLIDKLGSILGITSYAMTKFFETNDYRTLLPEE